MRVALHRDSKGLFDGRLKRAAQFDTASLTAARSPLATTWLVLGTYRWIIKPGPDDIEFRPHQKEPADGSVARPQTVSPLFARTRRAGFICQPSMSRVPGIRG